VGVGETAALLVRCLDNLKNLYQEMHDLALHLSVLVRGQDFPMSELELVLTKRDELMVRIDALNELINVKKKELADESQIKTAVDELRGIMESILQLDAENRAVLENSLGEVKDQLRQISSVRRVQQAYGSNMTEAIFVDKTR